MPNTYKVYEGGSQAVEGASKLAGASSGVPNPMSGILEAQAKYHVGEYGKIKSKGMKDALANEERANAKRRDMNTPQARASSMKFGENGITKENGYYQRSDGTVGYVRK